MTPLRAGWSRIETTPGREASLLGYEWRLLRLPPGNAGVRDPLAVRALVVAAGDGPPMVVVTLDLCIASVAWATALRERAAAAAGTVPDRVVVACSHTHSGPWPADCAAEARILPHMPAIGPLLERERDVRERERERIEAAVEEAVAVASGLLVPVRVAWRTSPHGLGYSRRVVTAGRLAHCWNVHEQASLRPGPHPDPVCVLCSLVAADGRRCRLWSAGAHPVVLGKTSRRVSADWPGAANAVLEADGGASLFCLGPCGEIHPWLATTGEEGAVDTVGTAAAAQVALLDASQAGWRDGGLAMASTTATIDGEDLPLTALRLGGGLLLALPVECFASLGAVLRPRLAEPAIIATIANGWVGYWADHAALVEGGYETDAGRRPGSGEALIDAVLELVGGLS